ncbi:hypothetical protein EYF80_049280 [Liparis tanakae]|uniref:Uncharacterized protein n=1 Tax=Liparis tanakae TaxID=230148 RepID=A0A4Z2FHC2_9TELE|nr:hypothetical protein EYF80_049280 [Liparis tanakae]
MPQTRCYATDTLLCHRHAAMPQTRCYATDTDKRPPRGVRVTALKKGSTRLQHRGRQGFNGGFRSRAPRGAANELHGAGEAAPLAGYFTRYQRSDGIDGSNRLAGRMRLVHIAGIPAAPPGPQREARDTEPSWLPGLFIGSEPKLQKVANDLNCTGETHWETFRDLPADWETFRDPLAHWETFRDLPAYWETFRDPLAYWETFRDPLAHWETFRDPLAHWETFRDPLAHWETFRDPLAHWETFRDLPADWETFRDPLAHWETFRDPLAHWETFRDPLADWETFRDLPADWETFRDPPAGPLG